MPIYQYKCKLCNKETESLEDLDTPFISVECCMDDMLCMYTKVDFTSDSNSYIKNGGTPRFNDKRRK